MSIHLKVNEDWIMALKNQQQDLKKVLTFMRSKLLEKAKSLKVDFLEDHDSIAVLKKMAKEQNDLVKEFFSPEAEYELKVINNYLPEMLSEEDILEKMKVVTAELGLELTKANSGRVMGAMMKALKGTADGALVRKVIEANLMD